MTDNRFVYVYIASFPSEECWPGSRGVNCAEDCAKGFYGRLCKKMCECYPCDKVNGCQNIIQSLWFAVQIIELSGPLAKNVGLDSEVLIVQRIVQRVFMEDSAERSVCVIRVIKSKDVKT